MLLPYIISFMRTSRWYVYIDDSMLDLYLCTISPWALWEQLTLRLVTPCHETVTNTTKFLLRVLPSSVLP